MLKRRDFLLATGLGAASLAAGGPAMSASDISARAAGFYVPAEWQPHARTFMQWPVSQRVYRSALFLKLVQRTIAELANTIAAFEPVVMLMDADAAATARRMLSASVEIWDIPTEDLWCRDSGPHFVVDGRGALAVSHLNFNGWGGRQVHARDALIARAVAERMGLELFDTGLTGEPGGAESDGAGTLIAHASSWVNRNRNRQSRAAVTELLTGAYGADKVIWAKGLKNRDITDYHIDSLARFTAPGEVLIQLPERVITGDVWSRTAYETRDVLMAATDASGRALNLTTILEPTRPRAKSLDFVASYVNYYVCNGAVIAAEFGDPEADARAAATLARLHPGREVVTMNADHLGEIGGGIHCATHEQPAT